MIKNIITFTLLIILISFDINADGDEVVIEEDENNEIEEQREEDVYQEEQIETSKSYYNYCWVLK